MVFSFPTLASFLFLNCNNSLPMSAVLSPCHVLPPLQSHSRGSASPSRPSTGQAALPWPRGRVRVTLPGISSSRLSAVRTAGSGHVTSSPARGRPREPRACPVFLTPLKNSKMCGCLQASGAHVRTQETSPVRMGLLGQPPRVPTAGSLQHNIYFLTLLNVGSQKLRWREGWLR